MATIQVPSPPPGLGTNLLGVAGLAAVVVAVGALTDWRWALLLAGVFAVALCWVAHQHQAAAAVPEAVDEAPPRPRLAAASAQ